MALQAANRNSDWNADSAAMAAATAAAMATITERQQHYCMPCKQDETSDEATRARVIASEIERARPKKKPRRLNSSFVM